MRIYVDALLAWSPSAYRGKASGQARRVGERNGHRWCHLFADVADCPELHEFAARLGMRREWFQKDHYDLVPSRREAAVRLGAVQVDRKTAVDIWQLQSRVSTEKRCPKCKGAVMNGYGMAAGGLGPYLACLDDECGWLGNE